MQIHDVGLTSVFYSVWVVIDVINNCKQLKYQFPMHEEQKEIAEGFREKSDADFDRVIGAINGIVICTLCPSQYFCDLLRCDSKSFRCYRKDKFGLNMQAICDHTL